MRGSISPEVFVASGMAWRIHRERVLLAGWGRAILRVAAATRGSLLLVPPPLRYWAGARRAERRLRR